MPDCPWLSPLIHLSFLSYSQCVWRYTSWHLQSIHRFNGVHSWCSGAPPIPLRCSNNVRCSYSSAHTLIFPFETPARIISETINPVPLLRMFFGGRRHGDDFPSHGNAWCCVSPPRRASQIARDATPTQGVVCFVQLHEWWICITLAGEMIFFVGMTPRELAVTCTPEEESRSAPGGLRCASTLRGNCNEMRLCWNREKRRGKMYPVREDFTNNHFRVVKRLRNFHFL